MKLITTLPASCLKAALNCAAIKDIRYYLNGLYIEVMSSETRIVSTDGNCAAVFRIDIKNDYAFKVIIPSESVKLALSLKSTSLVLENDGTKWTLNSIPFIPIDGKFPDYRRIIPIAFTNEAANFNPEILMKFVKIAKDLKLKNSLPIVRHNGEAAAQVQFYGIDYFVGVIMPVRLFTERFPDHGISKWGYK